jgi:hypothetical protein
LVSGLASATAGQPVAGQHAPGGLDDLPLLALLVRGLGTVVDMGHDIQSRQFQDSWSNL